MTVLTLMIIYIFCVFLIINVYRDEKHRLKPRLQELTDIQESIEVTAPTHDELIADWDTDFTCSNSW